MMHASSLAFASAFALRSSTSILPRSSQATVTVRMPAIAAEAGLVPCGRGRDQRDVAVSLPPALVVSTDNHKAGILARCTRIGLQRGACKTGDNRPGLSTNQRSAPCNPRPDRPERTDGYSRTRQGSAASSSRPDSASSCTNPMISYCRPAKYSRCSSFFDVTHQVGLVSGIS